MKDLTFEEYAAAWIYLLSETDNVLCCIPCDDDFAYQFRWEPRSGSRAGATGLMQVGEAD